MAKRDVWVRVGDDLVRGDTVLGVTVSDPHYHHETFKIMLKVTGHRDPLWLDAAVCDDDQGAGRERVNALADAFVDTLARCGNAVRRPDPARFQRGRLCVGAVVTGITARSPAHRGPGGESAEM
ncbi:hypothetical protein ABZ723_33075 [Streptomyces sp. NPDC006700]|uniref:hypothetical protein n=1 Tax=Streptomyces sp. NPDC006700 TaxID=3154479 RepID=UPI0034083AE8